MHGESPYGNVAPRAHLAVSEDVFFFFWLSQLERVCPWIEARDAAEHPPMHRTASMTKNSRTQSMNSVNVKKNCPRTDVSYLIYVASDSRPDQIALTREKAAAFTVNIWSSGALPKACQVCDLRAHHVTSPGLNSSIKWANKTFPTEAALFTASLSVLRCTLHEAFKGDFIIKTTVCPPTLDLASPESHSVK